MANSTLAIQLASIASTIERADGETTLMLLGPALCHCGPNTAGQLCIDITSRAGDVHEQSFFELRRDDDADPEVYLRDCVTIFTTWLQDHGVPTYDLDTSTPTDDGERFSLSVTFASAQWR